MRKRIAVSCALALAAASVLAQKPPMRPLPLSELQSLATAYGVLLDGMTDPAGEQELVVNAIRGMARLSDPEGGDFYTEEELRDQSAPQPPNNGIAGLEIVTKAGNLTVVAPLRGGPADAAGVLPGDVLVEIDGKRTAGLGTAQALRLLRGLPGSKVVLLLLRRGEGERVRLEVERRVFPRPSVAFERRDGAILVMRIDAFYRDTPVQAATGLGRELQQQPVRGLVLDLRRNSGGLLASAVGVAALFLPPQAQVASTQGRRPESNAVYKAEQELHGIGALARPEFRSLPMVVLVDEGTASGAELLAAALVEHGRAGLAGRRTFGRSSIQTQVALPGGGAVKYTSAHWYTPLGKRVGPEGLQPQLAIEVRDPARELELAADFLRRR